MGKLNVKPGARLDQLGLGGACILAALFRVAASLPSSVEIVVTSGTDGVHSGPSDPHHRGDAFDVRSQGLDAETKQLVLERTMRHLAALELEFGGPAMSPVPTSGGLATAMFFGQLESPTGPNEHLHFQLRKGRTLPPRH